jgi:hypothetical protein
MNAPVAIVEPPPIEIDPRPCDLCGCTIDRHHRVDTDEGPEFFCIDWYPDELTLPELERRAELQRQEEVAAIMARLEAMDDPSKRLAPSAGPEPHRPAKSTVDAFRYLTTTGDVEKLRRWLGDRPEDAPHLLALLEGSVHA